MLQQLLLLLVAQASAPRVPFSSMSKKKEAAPRKGGQGRGKAAVGQTPRPAVKKQITPLAASASTLAGLLGISEVVDLAGVEAERPSSTPDIAEIEAAQTPVNASAPPIGPPTPASDLAGVEADQSVVLASPLTGFVRGQPGSHAGRVVGGC